MALQKSEFGRILAQRSPARILRRKVATVIAEGLSLEDAAEKLGIAKATARNHLSATFAKTATHRQGELIALLSRL
jgi:DNA-binding CsgD family transcriptional regulator